MSKTYKQLEALAAKIRGKDPRPSVVDLMRRHRLTENDATDLYLMLIDTQAPPPPAQPS